MAVTANLFRAVADLATGAKARELADHQDFLAFYREVVETLPTDAVTTFGGMAVEVVGEQGWKIELTATDYLWWKEKIAAGARFKHKPSSIRIDMLNRLSRRAEASRLSPEERKALIALLDEAVPAAA